MKLRKFLVAHHVSIVNLGKVYGSFSDAVKLFVIMAECSSVVAY